MGNHRNRAVHPPRADIALNSTSSLGLASCLGSPNFERDYSTLSGSGGTLMVWRIKLASSFLHGLSRWPDDGMAMWTSVASGVVGGLL